MAIGRPREFDVDAALDRALDVFWRHGYEGAALSDLTEAMGINRPSLYAAYGNKESLFRKALERYQTGRARHAEEAMAEPTARAVVEKLLYGTVDVVTTPDCPRGCLVVQGALVTGDGASAAAEETRNARRATELRLRERFERARAEGDLPATADPAELARLVCAVSLGMSVQAADGAGREELRRVVATVLAQFPAQAGS